MSRRLNKNDVITINGDELEIVSLDPERDSVILFDFKTQAMRSMSLKQLRRKLADGEATSNAAAATRGRVKNLEVDKPSYAQFLYFDAIRKGIYDLVKKGHSIRKAINKLGESLITLATGETRPMCPERTAYRIMKMGNDELLAILPNYAARGNRTERYHPRMKEIILQVIHDLYAVVHSRFSIPKITETVNDIAWAEGILDKGKAVSRKYVRNFLVNNWSPDHEDYKRLHPSIAKSKKAIAKERIKPGAPLNRVEIDTVKLPFVYLRGHKKFEHLWLMHAIDCETSIVLGWWLMSAAPTTDDTYSCLGRAIFSKADLLTKMGINFTVDPYGLPMNIVFDNGPENSKPRLSGLTTLGINLQWAEVHGGHRKPFVERLNRSLKEAMETMPGCTRFQGKDGVRTTKAFSDDNLMTFEEIGHWIGRWYYECWAHTPLERFITAEHEVDKCLGITPAQRWEKFESENVLPLCPTREDWRRVRFMKSTGSLSARTGITFERFTFRGENLPHLIHQYGPDRKVDFFYNPHDFRTIYVPDKETREWIELVNSEVSSNTPAYSFDVAKQRKKEKRDAHDPSPFRAQFKSDVIARSTGKPSRKQAKDADRKAIFEDERAKQAQARADEHPLTHYSAPAPEFDTFVAADAVEPLVKHKKSGRITK